MSPEDREKLRRWFRQEVETIRLLAGDLAPIPIGRSVCDGEKSSKECQVVDEGPKGTDTTGGE